MSIAANVPWPFPKLRRCGMKGTLPAQTSRKGEPEAKTCRSYGACRASVRAAMNMALLTELLAAPPPPFRVEDACKVQRPRAQATKVAALSI